MIGHFSVNVCIKNELFNIFGNLDILVSHFICEKCVENNYRKWIQLLTCLKLIKFVTSGWTKSEK